MYSFTENGVPQIVVRIGRRGRQEHRRAIECEIPGRALLGPASFPGHRPETATYERATWTKSGWVIALRKVTR